MKYILKNCKRGLVIASFIMLVQGCKDPTIEDNTLVGNEGSDLNLETIDSFTVNTTTVPSKPEVMKLATYGVAALGSLNNVVFGNTNASFYTEFDYNSAIKDITGAVLDSCVLSLPYYAKYGECNQYTDVVVYEMAQAMTTTESYTADDAFPVKPSPLAVRSNFKPTLYDSVTVMGTKLAPQLRIQLSSAFGANLLAKASTYTDANLFRTDFNGLYVSTNATKIANGITYFNLDAAKLTLYYHNATDDSLKIELKNTTGTSIRFNHYDLKLDGSEAKTAMNNTNSETFFAIGGGGAKTYIEIPFLDSVKANERAIAKAELVILKAQPIGATDSIPDPNFLQLTRETSTGDEYTIVERNLSGLKRVGVPLVDEVTIGGVKYNRYTFLVSDIVQRIIDKKSSFDFKRFVLRAPSSYSTDYFPVYFTSEKFKGLNSKTNPDLRVKFKISYLKLN